MTSPEPPWPAPVWDCICIDPSPAHPIATRLAAKPGHAHRRSCPLHRSGVAAATDEAER